MVLFPSKGWKDLMAFDFYTYELSTFFLFYIISSSLFVYQSVVSYINDLCLSSVLGPQDTSELTLPIKLGLV